MARTALDLYVAAVASKKNGEFINTERLKEAYIGVVDAMAKEIERDGSSLLLNLFAARWYVGYPKSDVYIANLTKIELDANFSKYLNSWRSSDYKKQYSAKFKRIDTSGVVAILEGVQAFFDNSSDKDTILGRYSEHFKSYLFNKNISTKSLITLLPKKLENSTKHYTASAFAELIRAIDAALVKKQGSAKAIREAENKRQAELEARLQETEARRQAELRATQEAEARKQAELKAAEEERKRILLQAKLKEAEAKAKQDEKARKAEFEARRVQEAEARRQAELRETQEAENKRQAEFEARRVQEAEARRQAELRATQEAENKRQAELKARQVQEAEARRQAELRATQEAEARKQAELKAAEEERKRILLQAKLKEAEAKAKQEEKARKAEFEARQVQEAEARRQAELRATQEAEARKQAELKAIEAKAKQEEKARKAEFEARRVQEAEPITTDTHKEEKSFLMEKLMLENNIPEDDENWKIIHQFLEVAKSIHEIVQEFVGKSVKVKKHFINNNKVIKNSLEFAELYKEKVDGIDKRIAQIRNLIPQGEAINNEYAKKFVDAFEELLETITISLKDIGVERIPWPSTGRCSQDLLNEGYEKDNTESRFAKSANDYDKIYGELRVGIRIDDEIVQAPFFNVYE